MATKSETKKKDEVSVPTGEYLYGVGRRKTATAQVRLYKADKGMSHLVNKKAYDTYLPASVREMIAMPLATTGLAEEYIVSATVRGGGTNSQAEAIRLGVARALLKKDESFRAALRAEGYLTRDARAVERKKPGLKKARRAPQWSKR
jgi:small subunit ribosomal protein S9